MAILSLATPEQGSVADEMSAFNAFVELHQYQLAGLPESLWPSLFNKLCNDTLDAGNYFCLAELDEEEAEKLGGPYTLQVVEDKQLAREGDIFLLDHAWTTATERAREELEKNPQLLDRMANLMGIPEEEEEQNDEDTTSVDSWTAREDENESNIDTSMVELAAEQANVSKEAARTALIKENWDLINAIALLTLSSEAREAAEQLNKNVVGRMEKQPVAANQASRIGAVLNAMWRFAGTYQITMLNESGEHRQEHLWYIMDEVGSAIRHSNTPNCSVMPFLFVRGPNTSDTISYCVMYPMQDLNSGDRITRDMTPADITEPLTREAYLCAFAPPGPATAEQLIRSYKDLNASIKPLSDQQLNISTEPAILPIASTGILHVYTDATFLQEHLSLNGVEITNDRDAADLLWLTEDFAEKFDTLRPGQCINQLPGESCIVHKNRLTKLIWETFGRVDWYPETYNLVDELAPAVGRFLDAALGDDAEQRKENVWILKPWNAGHSIGVSITDTLSRLIRARDAIPSIAQRYLCRPLLYEGRKFDLRYIVLVRATKPKLRAAVYKMFWARLANKPYSLDDLHEYEKHFTMTNYNTDVMTQLNHTDFIAYLEKERPGLNWWSTVQPAINKTIGHVLKAAAVQSAPLGFSDKSADNDAFAVYGVDMMLTDQLQPVLLEVNFSPDCLRACQYEPEFVNHLISAVSGRSGVDKARDMFRNIV